MSVIVTPAIRHALVWPLLFAFMNAGIADTTHLGPKDVATLPTSAPTRIEAYGSDPLQSGELRLPSGRGPFPVAIIIHGGCFTKGFATLSYMAPLASVLTEKGIATWNIEYRQIGDAGGGWPGSYLDWAAAADHVRELAKTYPLDLNRVVALGHSAGATAALWLEARASLPASSEVRGGSPIKIRAAVAIDGPGDLAAWAGGTDAAVCGKPVVAQLLGGTAQEVPTHYAQGSPLALLPFGENQTLISSSVLTESAALAYQRAALDKGERVQVVVLHDAAHFDMLAPGRDATLKVEDVILKAAKGP